MRDRIRSAIERYAATGHGDVKPLKGDLSGESRLRIGDYRVIFRPHPSEQSIEILRILPRGKAYRVRETAEEAA
jgi:mRNA-degrading endonuclease RelE of RelBE toxin-antitoxin system